MRVKILFILVVILAFLLRFYKVDQVPATLYGDEQAFAWNAYSILLTGEDEYGTPYPLQFRSFNDYKAPIPVYLLVPFIKLFGLTPFAIRLPIVLASILTVVVAYVLVREFMSRKVSILATFLLAISPWHIHLSRGYFEATLALLWFVAGVYFLSKKPELKNVIAGMVSFILAVYSYFTPRMLLPLFILFLVAYMLKYRQRWAFSNYQLAKRYAIGVVILFIMALPLILTTVFGKGFSRFDRLMESMGENVVAAVNKDRNTSNLPKFWNTMLHNKVTVWIRLVKTNYLEHLSANFWYISGDSSLRYFTGNMGMFYLIEFPLLVIGIYFLWREHRRAAILFISWLILAPIPASLVGRPFAVRSLAMLPAPFVLVGYGIYKVASLISGNKLKTAFILVLTCGFVISLGSLLIRYYFEYPVYAATWWGWENKAAIDFAKRYEDTYDNIFISDYYTGVPLAFALYRQYDPKEFRFAQANPVTLADGRHLIKLGKYYFGSLDINKERLATQIIPPKSLYIARPEEADSNETIKAPDDGRILFKVYRTN